MLASAAPDIEHSPDEPTAIRKLAEGRLGPAQVPRGLPRPVDVIEAAGGGGPASPLEGSRSVIAGTSAPERPYGHIGLTVLPDAWHAPGLPRDGEAIGSGPIDAWPLTPTQPLGVQG